MIFPPPFFSYTPFSLQVNEYGEKFLLYMNPDLVAEDRVTNGWPYASLVRYLLGSKKKILFYFPFCSAISSSLPGHVTRPSYAFATILQQLLSRIFALTCTLLAPHTCSCGGYLH